jgi:Flp pilus assembly protein TadB
MNSMHFAVFWLVAAATAFVLALITADIDAALFALVLYAIGRVDLLNVRIDGMRERLGEKKADKPDGTRFS